MNEAVRTSAEGVEGISGALSLVATLSYNPCFPAHSLSHSLLILTHLLVTLPKGVLL